MLASETKKVSGKCPALPLSPSLFAYLWYFSLCFERHVGDDRLHHHAFSVPFDTRRFVPVFRDDRIVGVFDIFGFNSERLLELFFLTVSAIFQRPTAPAVHHNIAVAVHDY